MFDQVRKRMQQRKKKATSLIDCTLIWLIRELNN